MNKPHDCPGCNDHFKRKTDNCFYCNKAYKPKLIKTDNGLYIHLRSEKEFGKSL